MSALLDLALRTGYAIDHARLADEEQQAADEGHGTPGAAANAHREAAQLCKDMAERFAALSDGHDFMARRMDAESRREGATGIEYRGGSVA